MSKLEIFDAIALNQKNEECDQRYINISDQFETFILYSVICLLGIKTQYYNLQCDQRNLWFSDNFTTPI